jgi:hypothetical protein
MIRLEVTQENVRTGEQVTGHASWSSSNAKAPRDFRVTCRWRIEGKGRRKENVIDTAAGGNEIAFEFGIPLSGPLSYDGKLFRIIWEIVVTADIPFARDEVQVKSFLVRPRVWDTEEWQQLQEVGEEEDDDDGDDDEPVA